jgi:acyl-CoA synthetase (AMP-forming)/AMP-acid ligase II
MPQLDRLALQYNPYLCPILSRWQQNPDALAAMFYDGEDWHATSQRQLCNQALRFSALFSANNLGSGDLVLIILHHGVDAYAAFIGAMLTGAIPSFLPHPNVKQDAGLYWRQHQAVFAHSRPAAILAQHEFHQAVADAVTATNIKVLSTASVPAQPAALPPALPAGDQIALLQHSSGTTGLKKGVQLSYESICMQLDSYRIALRLQDTPDPRIASWLPLYHDMGLITSLLLPLWLGIPVIGIDPFEWTMRPSLFLDAVQDYQATHAWIPNFAFLHQIRTARGSKNWNLHSLIALISCSEPCKPEAFDAFLSRFQNSGITSSKLQTCYAMAEAVFAVTQSPIGQPVRRLAVDRVSIQNLGTIKSPALRADALSLLSNGPAVPGCRIKILNGENFAGEREVGEICIAAPFLFTGYHHNQAATQAAFHGEWYRTGDLGFLDNHELFIVGRIKDVIILNGKNIFAHDVEAAVSRVAGVKPGRAVALGLYAESLGSEQLIVIAESADPANKSTALESAINRAVLEETGIACTDVKIVSKGWLVKTTSGKMSRSENLVKYKQAVLF